MSDPHYINAKKNFIEKITSAISSFVERISVHIEQIEKILVNLINYIREIQSRDRHFINSQEILQEKIAEIKQHKIRIINNGKRLTLILDVLEQMQNRFNVRSDIDLQALRYNLNKLKFLFIATNYYYKDAVTGVKYQIQGIEIEITDEFIHFYQKEDIGKYRAIVDEFERDCNDLVANDFNLDSYYPEQKVTVLSYTLERMVEFLRNKLSEFIRTLEKYQQFNEILSKTYITHFTGVDNFRKIVQNGFLASQVYLVERGITPEARSIGGKSETLFDISFSFGIELQYGDVGFIFPCSRLLLDHSFYIRVSTQYSEFPELHLFHKNFDFNRNKIGCAIDLSDAVLLIPKTNKVPKSEQEKEVLAQVFSDILGMQKAIYEIKTGIDIADVLYKPGDFYRGVDGWVGYLRNRHRHFRWQLTMDELVGFVRGGRNAMIRNLRNKLKEYTNMPELEGTNPFMFVEEFIMGSGEIYQQDMEKNMEYYLTNDTELFWRSLFHQMARNPNSWLFGKNADDWINEHVIFYDRKFYYNIERIMRNYRHVREINSKDYNLLVRYASKILRKHAKQLLKRQTKGKIIPTNQIARPLGRDKDIILFEFSRD